MAGGQASMTPPFGLSLAVLHGVVPWHPMETIARACKLMKEHVLKAIDAFRENNS